jgi:hypothetical protein
LEHLSRSLLDQTEFGDDRPPMSTFDKMLNSLRGRPQEPRTLVARPAGLPEPRIRRRPKPLSEREEADLCDRLAEWLRDDSYDVYFEVPLGATRPDVVGIRGERTFGIEAKLSDTRGVVSQGLRIARRFTDPYIALPAETVGEAAQLLARIARQRPNTPLPGILSVDLDVVVIRQPSSHRRRHLPATRLRDTAERLGAERGGVPSLDRMERNLALEQEFRTGAKISDLARHFKMTDRAAARVVRRLELFRLHLQSCPGELRCSGVGSGERSFFAGAHKHESLLRAS